MSTNLLLISDLTIAQERAHDVVKQSLVHIVATGTPTMGPLAGQDQGVKTQGTGFFVSSDGFILTTDHLFDSLEKVKAKRIEITGRIGDSGSQSFLIQSVTALPRLDLVLLKASIPYDRPQGIPLKIGSSNNIDQRDPGQLMTSGFHDDNYRRKEVELNDTKSEDVPFAWTLNVKINSGQSGSPVYIENEKGVMVVGVIKATQRSDDELTLMIPVEYSMPLIGHLKFQELSDKVEFLMRVIGQISDEDLPLHSRVQEIEGYVEEIESHFTWSSESREDGSLRIRYEKIISGGPQVDKIQVQITPNMRFYENSPVAGDSRVYYSAPTSELRLAGNGVFSKLPLSADPGTGFFVIPGIEDSLNALVGLTAKAVGPPEPYRDLEIRFIPFIGDQPLSTRRLYVVPEFDWEVSTME